MSNEVTNPGSGEPQLEPLPAYERQEGEPQKKFQWFHCYLMLGAGRSLREAYKQFTGSASSTVNVSPSWREACKTWEWHRRAACWDDEQMAARDVELEALRQKRFDRLYKASDKLLDTMERMEQFPLADVQIQVNGISNIIPAKWNRNTAAKYLATAASVSKIAFEMEQKGRESQIDREKDEQQEELIIEVLRSRGFTVIGPDVSDESENDDDE